ncbi:MAG: hypothetical protein KME10_28015 [Plectolyngbya sp. WJT66-NPBG17]|jgi:hypothetical protein|nr:hypothetical protein [Plectolyngbya sp. WJT66-NPBG17]
MQSQNFRSKVNEVTDNPFFFWVAVFIFCTLIGISLKVITVNIEPYLSLTGAPNIKPSNIPIVGWAYDVLNILYVATGAFLVWSLIQICQVIWILISLDRKAQRTAIKESQKELRIQGSNFEGDDRVRKIKKRAVGIPFFFMAASGYIALSAYIAEIIINARQYPLITSWVRFMAGLTIGNLSAIRTDNVIAMCWNLFSTEFLIVALIVVGQWVWSHKNG